MNKNKTLKIVILIALISGVLIALLNHEVRAVIAHPHRLKRYIESFRSFAPIIFIVLYTLRTFLVVLPASVFAIASGALFSKSFGYLFSFIFSMIGSFLSASIAFWLGKNLMSDFVQKHLADKIKFLKEHSIGDFKLILYLRLIMIMPFDAFGYVAGAANIKYKDFILGTMLGIIPEFLGYTYLGSTGARRDISWKKKIIMSVGLVVLILIGHFGKKAFEKFKKKEIK